MFRGDDDIIMDDPYWTRPSSPSSSHHWDDTHLDMSVYFPYSSGPSSPSTIKSENEDEEWRIEYQKKIKKLRTELQYDYYIDLHVISRPYSWISAIFLPSTRGRHSYDCWCYTSYDWTKDPSVSSNT